MIKIPPGQMIIATLLLQFATVSPCSPKCVCDKGNTHCSGMSLTAVPANVESNTTAIDMSFNNISTLTNKDFVNLTHLEILLLNNNDISSLEPYVFHQTIKLLHLDLSNNKIDVINLSLLKSLNQLRRLYLQNNAIQYIHPNLFDHNHHLVLLDISGNHIKYFEPETFQNNPILLWVNVIGNPITIPLEMTTLFNNAFNILEIEFCDFIDSPISTFQNLPSMNLIGTQYTTAVNLDEFTAFPDALGLNLNETAYFRMKMFSHLNRFSFDSVNTMTIGDDLNVRSITGEDILCYCLQYGFWFWCVEDSLTGCDVTKTEKYEILGCNTNTHNANSSHEEGKDETSDTKKRERLFWPYHCPVNRHTLQNTLIQAAIPLFIIILVIGAYIFRRVRSARQEQGSLPSYLPVKS